MNRDLHKTPSFLYLTADSSYWGRSREVGRILGRRRRLRCWNDGWIAVWRKWLAGKRVWAERIKESRLSRERSWLRKFRPAWARESWYLRRRAAVEPGGNGFQKWRRFQCFSGTMVRNSLMSQHLPFHLPTSSRVTELVSMKWVQRSEASSAEQMEKWTSHLDSCLFWTISPWMETDEIGRWWQFIPGCIRQCRAIPWRRELHHTRPSRLAPPWNARLSLPQYWSANQKTSRNQYLLMSNSYWKENCVNLISCTVDNKKESLRMEWHQINVGPFSTKNQKYSDK